eukprot:TRINITY_DN7640_c0_g3_i1.p1 TRINITY_DN7640_c0_g3~~TRINITY_DN7640_c0_g3_i1.p1  ORF type:complete len:368 (+),score=71.34 TRINITY_DN7640_c0_g3_i1:1127-2230(+)
MPFDSVAPEQKQLGVLTPDDKGHVEETQKALLGVVIMSRGGSVQVNYWPYKDKQEVKELQMSVEKMAKMVLGYEILHGFPVSSSVLMNELTLLVACREHSMCVVVCSKETLWMRCLTSVLCDTFELQHSTRLAMFNDMEGIKNEEASGMKTDKIISDSPEQASTPFKPDTLPEFLEFERIILTTLISPTASFFGIIHALASIEPVLCCSIILADGKSLTCTGKAAPWDVDPELPHTPDEQLNLIKLKGLYSTGHGAVWKMCNDAFAEATDLERVSFRLSGHDGSYVDAHIGSCEGLLIDGQQSTATMLCLASASPFLTLHSVDKGSIPSADAMSSVFATYLDHLRSLPKPSHVVRNPLDPLNKERGA